MFDDVVVLDEVLLEQPMFVPQNRTVS